MPNLSTLPPPPPGKTGWPFDRVQDKAWAEDSPQLPDGSPWPRISVVTPSYNQGQFIEETIRSVLLQGYPDLEYIIIDGGSTDASVDIIRKYEPWLAYWVSEPDRGQSHAINKGLAVSTGDVLAYLNADDVYEPGALAAVARCFDEHPEADLVYGNGSLIGADGQDIREVQIEYESSLALAYGRGGLLQPSVFWRRRLYERIGPFDEELHYALDYDYWLRASKIAVFQHLPQRLSRARRHESSKTSQGWLNFTREGFRIYDRYWQGEERSAALKHWLFFARRHRLAMLQTALSSNSEQHGFLQQVWWVISGLLANPSLLFQLWFQQKVLLRILGKPRAIQLRRIIRFAK